MRVHAKMLIHIFLIPPYQRKPRPITKTHNKHDLNASYHYIENIRYVAMATLLENTIYKHMNIHSYNKPRYKQL